MADIFNLTDTWNNAGTTFAGIKMNVVNTASAAASRPLDIQVGGVPVFDVRPDGLVAAPQGIASSTSAVGTYAITPAMVVISNAGTIGWGTAFAAIDPALIREGSGIIAQAVATIPQTFRVYNTRTDASNYERGVFDWTTTPNELTISTQAAGTGTVRAMRIGPPTSNSIYIAPAEVSFVEGAATKRIQIYSTSFKLGLSMVLAWNPNTSVVGGDDVGLGRSSAGVLEVNTSVSGTLAALRVATLRRSAPVTKTADFTVADTDSYIILNKGSAGVVTLPAAASYTGREIMFTNIQAFAWTSASANVVPRVGGAAANAILAATDGAWCKLISDGTSWINLCGTP